MRGIGLASELELGRTLEGERGFQRIGRAIGRLGYCPFQRRETTNRRLGYVAL